MKRSAPTLAPGAEGRLTALVSSIPALGSLAAAPFDIASVLRAYEEATNDLDEEQMSSASRAGIARTRALLNRLFALEMVARAYTGEIVSGVAPRAVTKVAREFNLCDVRKCEPSLRYAVAAWILAGVPS